MTYLVTGATGFIGRFLVERLARRDGDIHVLVRASSAHKLDRLAERWAAADASVVDRIKPVIGDLSLPNLGIEWDWIEEHTGRIEHVFHLAAVYDMEADEEANRVANVGGTREAVKVANALRAGRFHHTSSVAAAGLYRGEFTEDMFDEGQSLEHPYHATKFESERIVREETTVPWRVYRPAIVLGHSRTGEMDKLDGPYYFFKALALAAHLPGIMPAIGPRLGETNVVPVDFVADAMDHIAHLDGLDGRAFHLVSPEPQGSIDVLNTFARAAGAPQLTSVLPKLTVPLALKVPGVRGALLPALGIPDAALEYIDFTARFDTVQADAALAGSGITVPPLEDYADVLWRYWEQHIDGDGGGATVGRTPHAPGESPIRRPLRKASAFAFGQVNKVVDWHRLPLPLALLNLRAFRDEMREANLYDPAAVNTTETEAGLMARELPTASLVDTVQFNQAIIVPNAVQGIFRRRPAAVGVATRLDLDGRAVRLMEGLRDRYGSGPVWIRVMTDRALLCLDVEDVARTLDGSPHPFASDPAAKRKGMAHFQPDALTISRGELWENRRVFTEAVLQTPAEAHALTGDILDVIVEEVDALFEAVGGGPLDQDAWQAMFRRLVRRVVLGDAAADDEEISELLAGLMSGANGLPSEPAPEYPGYMERLGAYVDAGQPGSLTSLIAAAPQDVDTRVEGQITHWLFALQDTLSINVLRALALLATHPEPRATVQRELEGEEAPYLAACLQEAMRLYPTTPLLSRETLVDVAWHGVTVPAGTQVLIVNAFHHRDRAAFAYADRFAPEEWVSGNAAHERAFNHFSQGPQGCPGRNLALLIGTAVLAQVLRAWPRLEATDGAEGLDPARPLPYSLNPYALRFGPGAVAVGHRPPA